MLKYGSPFRTLVAILAYYTKYALEHEDKAMLFKHILSLIIKLKVFRKHGRDLS